MPAARPRRVIARALDALADRLAPRVADRLAPVLGRAGVPAPGGPDPAAAALARHPAGSDPKALGLAVGGVDTGSRVVVFEYPVRPRPRHGHGLAAHPRLEALCAAALPAAEAWFEDVLAVADDLASVPVRPAPDPAEPWWDNPTLPGLDAASLYAVVAQAKPARYVEVGSGMSTRFVRRAVRDHDLATHLTCIEPWRRPEVDALGDEVQRCTLEDADLSVFGRLEAGDVVFVDHSHRAFQNSDTTVVFLEVLPELPAGVIVGIHDVFLPDDYPPEWADRLYSEQYLLASWLLGGAGGAEVLLPAWYASRCTGLSDRVLAPLWARLDGVQAHGNAFWFRTGPGPA